MLVLDSLTCSSSGANGFYWQYSRGLGIKVCTTDIETRAEGNWLKELNKLVPGLFPVFDSFQWIKLDQELTLAYRMEHIDGRFVYIESECNQQIIDRNLKRMGEVQLFWKDIHAGNMRKVGRREIRFLDPDPHFFLYKGSKAINYV